MLNSNSGKQEKSLLEIIHIIYKNKLWIIFSILLFIVLSLIYNQIANPVFESEALLKKEVSDKKQTSSDFYDIIQMQTQDEVETEIELVKTSEIISGVVRELNLFIHPTEIVRPNGTSIEINNILIDYSDIGNNYIEKIGFKLPKIKDVQLINPNLKGNFYIIKKRENLFELRNAENNFLISTSNTNSFPEKDSSEQFIKNSYVIFKNISWEFKFNWESAPISSKFYFNTTSISSTVNSVARNIDVSRIGKTNVFKISVKASTPFIAKRLAECLIDKFREARIDQQKQTIRYSFKFVDQQLDEIRTKLAEAENNLSNFKASDQIISIDESSQELVKYLSTLEAEKLNTDLQLSDYKNKAEELEKELKSSGFFDQSNLEPEKGGGNINSPFSSLLKQLSDLELQRLELLQKRSENHPDVKSLDDQIKLAKEKLASYNQNTLSSYQIMINTLEKKLLKITNLMSRYEMRMQNLPSQESKLVRLIRQKNVYEKIFTLLLDKREEMRMAEVSKLQDIIIVDPPQEPLTPVSPKKKLNLLLAIVIGGFVGLISIFVVELKKSRLIDIDSIEEDIQLPLLAIVPKFEKEIIKRMESPLDNNDKFVLLMDSHLGIKESFRLIKTKLNFQLNDNEKIVLVTSCEENTGKTTIVSNLAITLALEDKKVLIIDADLRKAELTKLFNLSIDTPGLVDYLTKEQPPSIYTKVMRKIDIIPAGGLRENSGALLNSEKMKLLIEALEDSEYDFILVDTPPVTRVVDTLILGLYVKNLMLVVRPNISFKESVIAGIREMKQAKLKIRGVVANAADIKSSYSYKYKYGYGYGYSSGKNGKGNKDIGMNMISKVKKNKITTPTNI